ncbi:MAG: type I-E CRISPR-associated protein Cse2/CasB [Kiritimatiellia bacterium]|mgnify:CR=1 FL=1|jgi:CRISPR system Cascade subunit CasB|nr:type I-E CRISPR-associated protein Cse2/CasB [Methanosarcina mazei]
MSKTNLIQEFVKGKIGLLQNDSPWSKAMLAKLRRGIGKDPAETPGIWEVTLDGIPGELTGYEGTGNFVANEAEMAIHAALTLYSLHQQGNGFPVNAPDRSFASAIRNLISADKANENAIKRRFDAIITSDSLTELSNHARGLIQMMRASKTPVTFDYPRLAKDLYRFQYDEGREEVRLSWGLDFYRMMENKE